MRDPSEDELDALMSRLSDGDRTAFDQLFHALYPRALRLARATLPADVVHDAAQSAMMKLFARASDFESGKAVLPWFYAIAGNEVHALSRSRSVQLKRNAQEEAAERLPSHDDPERRFLEEELRSSLRKAVSALDSASATAIAAILNEERPAIPSPAFRKRVSRAYARLRLLLGGHDAK